MTLKKNQLRKGFSSLALLSIEILVVLLLFIASLLVFIFTVNQLFPLHDTAFDLWVFQKLQTYVNDINTRIMVFFSFFGSQGFLLPANLGVASYYLFYKNRRWFSITAPVVPLQRPGYQVAGD